MCHNMKVDSSIHVQGEAEEKIIIQTLLVMNDARFDIKIYSFTEFSDTRKVVFRVDSRVSQPIIKLLTQTLSISFYYGCVEKLEGPRIFGISSVYKYLLYSL